MINRWTQRVKIITSHTWLLWELCLCASTMNPAIFTHTFTPCSSLLILPPCVPWCLLLKVKCYSRSKVTINMTKNVSLSFPHRPDTENNFPVFPGICRYGGKWRYTAPRTSGLLKVTSAVSTHLLMWPIERRGGTRRKENNMPLRQYPSLDISMTKCDCLIPFHFHFVE